MILEESGVFELVEDEFSDDEISPPLVLDGLLVGTDSWDSLLPVAEEVIFVLDLFNAEELLPLFSIGSFVELVIDASVSVEEDRVLDVESVETYSELDVPASELPGIEFIKVMVLVVNFGVVLVTVTGYDVTIVFMIRVVNGLEDVSKDSKTVILS